MREEFSNNIQEVLVFDDNGITFHNSKYSMKPINEHGLGNCYCPYGSLNKVKLFLGSLTVDFRIKNEVFYFTFATNSADKKRIKAAVDFATSAMKTAPKADGVNLDATNEHRMVCNVCGKVFCYSDEDLRKNEVNNQWAKISSNQAVSEALGGTRIMSHLKANESEAYKSKIVDYSKCPECNSTDIREVSEEEWQNLASKPQTAPAAAASAADELKKFKELLDMGAITQEEFDAKKKQLLGL